MTSSSFRISAVALTIAATIAAASIAEAGGYRGNSCVGKKQSALGKYAKAVTKAWDQNGMDTAGRDDDIATAKGKLDAAWTKEEDKAASKEAACNESTSTSTQAATAVNGAATSVSGDTALGEYIADALKAWGKYIKDPLKDPGKTKLNAALADAVTDELTGAAPATITAANTLLADLVDKTTNAPNYPTTFQTIQPSVCAGGVCGGTDTTCAVNADCTTQLYGKTELAPTCVDINSPYMYFARKGTNNKVLMYYQGGGACWDGVSCFQVPGSTCSRTAEPNDNPGLSTTGFADYSNPNNPFADWNVVFITYCTCDVHWGDAQAKYGNDIALHRGRVNAALVEKFAREHFVDPEQVFVTGSSAGSYGALLNSYFLMRDVWPNADFAVLGDAGVGVITKRWLDLYIDNWGVQNNFPTDLPNIGDLDVKELSLVDLIADIQVKFPNARFANYDSSYDGGPGSQTNFFQVMRYPQPPNNFLVDWGRFYEPACEWNACMREFKAENASRSSKYKLFNGAGSRHTIFGSDKVYVETKSTEADGTPRTFVSWVQSMIDNDADWVDVDCNNPGGDCNLVNTCQGGTNAGGDCTTNGNLDCPGGSCQNDPDSANAPYNNDDTVTCAPTTCPCGTANGECFGGEHAGDACDADADCQGTTNGTCSYVNCPAE